LQEFKERSHEPESRSQEAIGRISLTPRATFFFGIGELGIEDHPVIADY
jgi:hypothetical protein